MQTITFYSYKGGVGRTLAVANTARYLSSLGQRVFCMDFDLEAPGLHHKLKLGALPKHGLTDYIYSFMTAEAAPVSLLDSVAEVGHARAPEGPIWLMPAGAIPNPEYWKRLAALNWHDMFYSASAPGVGLFASLKEAIRSEFKPDFLLIDARTGITEAGGVATTIMPDVVVCLLLQTTEHLEGARAVMRSISNVERLGSEEPIEVRPVLSRLPKFESDSYEEGVIARVTEYLEEPVDLHEKNLTFPGGLRVLHGDPDLEREERLLIGPGSDTADSALLQDYLRLCGDLVPRESITDRIGDLINNAMINLLEAPEQAERNLEALARYSDHPDAYRELIKVYRLRHDSERMIDATTHLWRLTAPNADPLMVEVVTQVLAQPGATLDDEGLPADLAEATWKATGRSVDLGVIVARGYAEEGSFSHAQEVIQVLLSEAEVTPAVATLALYVNGEFQAFEAAEEIVDRYGTIFVRSDEFLPQWAATAIKSGRSTLAQKLLDNPRAEQSLRMMDPGTYIQVMRVAGADDSLLKTMIDENTLRLVRAWRERQRDLSWRRAVERIAKEYVDLHGLEAFEHLLQEELPSTTLVRELLRSVTGRPRLTFPR